MLSIIAACAAVFVFAQPTLQQLEDAEPPTVETAEFSLGFPDDETRWFYEHALIPCEVSRGFPLRFDEIVNAECHPYPRDSAKGNNVSGPVVFADKNVWFPVLSSVFMHGSPLHLAMNMLVLWSIGRSAEAMIGAWRFLALFFASGVAASAGFVAVDAESTTMLVGASGAISGVLGALFVWTSDNDLRRWIAGLALINVIGWAVAAFAAIDFGIAWTAHLVGLAFGAVVGLAFLRPVTRPRPARRSEPAVPYDPSVAEHRLDSPGSRLSGPSADALPSRLRSTRSGTSPPPPPPPPSSYAGGAPVQHEPPPPPPPRRGTDRRRESNEQAMADYFRQRYVAAGSGRPVPKVRSPITDHFRRRWSYWVIGILCLAIGLAGSAWMDGSSTGPEADRSAAVERAESDDERQSDLMDEAETAENELFAAMDDYFEASDDFVETWNDRIAGKRDFAIRPEDVFAVEAELVAARRHLERARDAFETADAAYSSLSEDLGLPPAAEWRENWQEQLDEAEAWLRVNERDVAELG